MIFVTLGSQKFQFNRLLKKIDELVAKGVITDIINLKIMNIKIFWIEKNLQKLCLNVIS